MPGIRELTAIVREIGDVVKQHVAAAFAPLAERVKALEERQAEKGDRGEPGEKGEAGKDAEPVLVSDVVRELIACAELRPVLDLLVAEGVAKHFEANPVQNGRDGKDGATGQPGKSVTIEDVSLFLDAAVAKHVLELERRAGDTIQRAIDKIPVPKDGKDGRDGKDGLSMADITRTYDGEAHEIIERWTAGGENHELRYPAGGISPGGFWKEGTSARSGQAFTHDGHLWFAKRDTRVKPALDAKDDWQLAARKGRDGKDGRNGIDKTAPVKLESGK